MLRLLRVLRLLIVARGEREGGRGGGSRCPTANRVVRFAGRCGNLLRATGEHHSAVPAAAARQRPGDGTHPGGGGGRFRARVPADHLHARRNLGPQHLPADERDGNLLAAGDHAGVMQIKSLSHQKHHRCAAGINSLSTVIADQFRCQIGDSSIKELKPAAGVLVGNLGGHGLQGQFAVELINTPHQAGHLAIAVGTGVLRTQARRLLHRFDAAGELHRLPHTLVGRLRVGQREPV